MRRTRLHLILSCAAITAALLIAGCGGDDDDPAPAADQTEAPAPKPAAEPTPDGGHSDKAKPKAKPGVEIKLASSPVGEALFDGSDQAIYLFDLEDGPESECYGECAVEWPPVLTSGRPVAEGAVDQSLLGTIKRDDGTTQVTYNDHPLYYYFDEGPGELRCHNIPGFGGLWLALDETGNALS